MKIILFLVVVTLSTNAFCGILVKDYDKYKNLELTKMYITGVGEGYQWANTKLELEGSKQMFCAPRNLALNQNNYLRIMDDSLKNKNLEIPDTMPIELLLLQMLIRTFPCK